MSRRNFITRPKPDFTGRRVGIYAGTFNPVHSGHIAFALQAAREAELDRVYFLPERRPRFKQGVEHFGHRVAMLKRAAKPHPQFSVLELNDIDFTVDRTLPKLSDRFRGGQLIFLLGSDAALQLADWPNLGRFLNKVEIVVGLRQRGSDIRVREAMRHWPLQPPAVHLFESFAPEISSRDVREALYQRQAAPGLLTSVQKYSDRHWLYVSLAG